MGSIKSIFTVHGLEKSILFSPSLKMNLAFYVLFLFRFHRHLSYCIFYLFIWLSQLNASFTKVETSSRCTRNWSNEWFTGLATTVRIWILASKLPSCVTGSTFFNPSASVSSSSRCRWLEHQCHGVIERIRGDTQGSIDVKCLFVNQTILEFIEEKNNQTSLAIC